MGGSMTALLHSADLCLTADLGEYPFGKHEEESLEACIIGNTSFSNFSLQVT